VAIAGRVATEGSRVALAARGVAATAGAAQGIVDNGGVAAAFALDVTDVASIHKAVGAVEEELGPIDTLVNNAAMQRLRLAVDVTEEDWDIVHRTNLRGAFFVAQAVGRGMVARG